MNLKLNDHQAKMLLVYLEMAYETAVNQQLPLSQDGIKALVKQIKSQKKGKKS
jgi:hypothetical protein